MKEVMIFQRTETMWQSIASDVVTFSFLLLCIWFSYSQGGGWWTFFTCCMFIVSMSSKLKMATSPRWVKLTTKKEAIDWAQSLQDD